MDRPPAQGDSISFGPFTLVAAERLLKRGDSSVALGARTLDTLIALVSRPNEVIRKHELMALVWPDATVEEASLRFHIAGLRKALGDGKDGARYISTLSGQGYCFVAPVSLSRDRLWGRPTVAVGHRRTNLPNRLMTMIGRTDSIVMLLAEFPAARFVTIVGAGGVGKTTVAVAVGHDLLDALEGEVLFFDLGAIRDPNLIAASLASLLGMVVQSEDPLPGLLAYLRDKRILLILDTCEHLIEAVASLVAGILSVAPHVHVLATSREALRIEGEHVYRLPPLATAPDDPALSAAETLAFPATQLFLARVVASGASLDLTDANAAIIAAICRRLDGLPLAIELAAGRVEAYGLQQTAALLEQRLALPWQGHRTAPPRQRTLQATLDWSVGLLSDLERTVLRRLAVFVGHFTIEAALEVIPGVAVNQAAVFGTIDSLVAKSMVAARPLGAMMRYRLLDATRAYALEITVEDAEFSDLAMRHATYCRHWLEQTRAEWPTLSDPADRATRLAGLGNVRAALEWCFYAGGDAGFGVGLVSAAAPVFLAMSLITECHRWAKRATLAMDDATRGSCIEMHIQAALGMSLMFAGGSNDEVSVALNRSLAIAARHGDALTQLKLLSPLRMFHSRLGDFTTALHHAENSAALAQTVADPAALALAHSMLGNSLYISGDLSNARIELEAALAHRPGGQRTSMNYLGFDGYNMARVTLAGILWLQGHPVQAQRQARQSVCDAACLEHPVTLSVALIWAIFVFLGTGDLQSADEHIDRFISNANTHSLGPYLAVGCGFKGQLAVRLDDPQAGVESLQACLAQLHAMRYELLTTPFNISLIEGLAATDRVFESMTLAVATIRQVEARGDLVFMPELLRLKGKILLATGHPTLEAGSCFQQSLMLSRQQGALTWELRTAVDLATLLAAEGRSDAARALLQPVFERHDEGADSADWRGAARLLGSWGYPH